MSKSKFMVFKGYIYIYMKLEVKHLCRAFNGYNDLAIRKGDLIIKLRYQPYIWGYMSNMR
jgi:hypothetical protein